MAVISRTTVTTTRTTGFRSSTVPVWVIKLITVILALIVLFLIYRLQDRYGGYQYYPKTFFFIAVTCGVLLGWSIGSVLQQIFYIRTVEILVNIFLTALAVLSLIFAISITFNSNWSSSPHNLMIGIAVCFLVETILCILMLSWAYYGNLVVIQSA